MGRRRTPGLRNRKGIWHIDKQILGQKIYESTGTSELETAELVLARRIEEIRQAKVFGVRPKRTFREAATKFLEENMHLASIDDYAMHIKQLDPYIGNLPLQNVLVSSVVADEETDPVVMQPAVSEENTWRAKIDIFDVEKSALRLVLELSGLLFYAETPAVFIDYDTTFSRDNFSD